MAGNSGDPGRTVASKVAVILAAFTAGVEHTLSQAARLPLHATALGKALLAFLRPVVVRLLIAQGCPATPRTR